MSDSPALNGRDEVVQAIEDMRSELEQGAVWENDTLVRYLEALAAVLGSIENAYSNDGRPLPESPWHILMEALRGARDYE